MKTPFFTVLITAYNYGCYIEAAIQSALDQSFSRDLFEVIVIDDGSTDETAERVARFGNAVRYYYQENAGQAAAFNSGISHAKGEFIAFLDADDVWFTNKLEYLKNYLDANRDVDLVYHSLTMVDTQGGFLGIHPKYSADRIVTDPLNVFQNYALQEAAATSGIICRLQRLKQLLPIPTDYRICADSYLAVTTPLVVSAIGFIAQPFTAYRIHSRNGFSSYDADSDRYICLNAKILMDKSKLDLKSVEDLSSKLGLDMRLYSAQYKLQLTVQEILFAREHSGILCALLLLFKSSNYLNTNGQLTAFYRFISILFRVVFGMTIFNAIAAKYTGSTLHKYIHIVLNSCRRRPVHE